MKTRAVAALAALLVAGVARAAGTDEAIARGGKLFGDRCALCHGSNADGKGQLAKMLDPKPANLRASLLDRGARESIIRHGGAAVGRSPAMPRWEVEFDEQQLDDVIAYVDSIVPAHSGNTP
ncbi:MAG TPA: cytochrome c [Burkholderiaceae bacterium]